MIWMETFYLFSDLFIDRISFTHNFLCRLFLFIDRILGQPVYSCCLSQVGLNEMKPNRFLSP